jgi:hypothetical protein
MSKHEIDGDCRARPQSLVLTPSETKQSGRHQPVTASPRRGQTLSQIGVIGKPITPATTDDGQISRRSIMFSKPSIQRFEFSRPLPQPVVLTPSETKRVSGGGSNVQHGNPGGGPASYNTPGNGPPGGDGGASQSGGFDVHDE